MHNQKYSLMSSNDPVDRPPCRSLFVHRTPDPPSVQIPANLCYVNQDNYQIHWLSEESDQDGYIYSDAATSCVILIAQGRNAGGQEGVALSHVSSPERLEEFFQKLDGWFCGPVKIWGQGANPPSSTSAQDNAETIEKWVAERRIEQGIMLSVSPWFVEEASLFLLEGHALEENRGSWGVDLRTGVISNRAFALSADQRDPSGGVQTLFTFFGSQLKPALSLWPAGYDFSPDVIKQLVACAKRIGWENLLYFPPAWILQRCSSTPEEEVPWFVEAVQRSAQFVADFRLT